ncbi:MAG: hypothetical protein WEB56_15260 [Roseovarius sp.]
MSRPGRGTILIAGLTSAAILAVSGIAVWRHLGGTGGDTPAQRSAVIAPIAEVLDAARDHSDRCAAEFSALITAASATDDAMARLESCGDTARALAERGYVSLDTVPQAGEAPDSTSPRRAEYLDSAGSLLSMYELQGDDFDVVYDMMARARATGATLSSLSADAGHVLNTGAPDVEAARKEATRAEAAYRKGG